LERLVGIVAKAPRLRHDTTPQDRLREEKILQRLAAFFRVDEAEVRRHLTAVRRRAQARPAAALTDQPSPAGQATVAEPTLRPAEGPDPFQRELLELLIAHPQQWPIAMARIAPEQVRSPACRKIYDTGCRLVTAGQMADFARLMLELDDPGLKSLLVELDEGGRAKGDRAAESQSRFEELLKNFEQKEVEKRRPAQTVALREQNLDTSQEIALLEDIIRQERSRQGISKPTDG
jgi:hypothetical protein